MEYIFPFKSRKLVLAKYGFPIFAKLSSRKYKLQRNVVQGGGYNISLVNCVQLYVNKINLTLLFMNNKFCLSAIAADAFSSSELAQMHPNQIVVLKDFELEIVRELLYMHV